MNTPYKRSYILITSGIILSVMIFIFQNPILFALELRKLECTKISPNNDFEFSKKFQQLLLREEYTTKLRKYLVSHKDNIGVYLCLGLFYLKSKDLTKDENISLSHDIIQSYLNHLIEEEHYDTNKEIVLSSKAGELVAICANHNIIFDDADILFQEVSQNPQDISHTFFISFYLNYSSINMYINEIFVSLIDNVSDKRLISLINLILQRETVKHQDKDLN